MLTNQVTDSVYCNSVARITLESAYRLASVVGQPVNKTYAHVADKLVIVFNTTGQYHPEFKGYKVMSISSAWL